MVDTIADFAIFTKYAGNEGKIFNSFNPLRIKFNGKWTLLGYAGFVLKGFLSGYIWQSVENIFPTVSLYLKCQNFW